MPNAPVLPEATTRRAALGAIIAAGAVGATLALPAVAATSAASSHHPDAELFALIERAKTADSAATDAYMAADDVDDVLEPSFPNALIWTESDEPPRWFTVRSGERVLENDVDLLRNWLLVTSRPDAKLVPFTPAFSERVREIIRAKDEYEAARRAAKEHPDVLAAAARREVLTERWRELAERVATTPAKTPEGLLAKFALVACGYDGENLDGTYDGILASAALDVQALAKGALMNAVPDRRAILGAVVAGAACISVPCGLGSLRVLADPVLAGPRAPQTGLRRLYDVGQTNVLALYDRAKADEAAAAELRRFRELETEEEAAFSSCSRPGRQRRPRRSPASSTSRSAAWRRGNAGVARDAGGIAAAGVNERAQSTSERAALAALFVCWLPLYSFRGN